MGYDWVSIFEKPTRQRDPLKGRSIAGGHTVMLKPNLKNKTETFCVACMTYIELSTKMQTVRE